MEILISIVALIAFFSLMANLLSLSVLNYLSNETGECIEHLGISSNETDLRRGQGLRFFGSVVMGSRVTHNDFVRRMRSVWMMFATFAVGTVLYTAYTLAVNEGWIASDWLLDVVL